MQFLNISHCQHLKEIMAGSFRNNIKLRTVVISGNPDLEHFNSEAFNVETQLTSLDLRRNGLRTLSVNLLDWSYVENLQLSENMWHCDCDLKWLQRTIFHLVNSTEASVRIVKCFSPNYLWNKDIVTASIEHCEDDPGKEKFQAEEKSVIFSITIIFVSLVVFITTSFITTCVIIHCLRKYSHIPSRVHDRRWDSRDSQYSNYS